MPRKVYVWQKGEKGKRGKFVLKRDAVQKLTPGIYIQQDSMPATWHPGDNRTYESKSAFRRATKALGLIELGNEPLPQPERAELPDPEMEIKEAWDAIEQGAIQFSEEEREYHRQNNERNRN